jgi:hypothetical protein
MLTAAGLPPALRRAWENWAFDPTSDVTAPWMRETLLPGDTRPLATGLLQAVGLVQYDIFAPKGKGTAIYETMRDSIEAVFEPGVSLALGNGHFLLIVALRPLGSQEEANSPWIGFPLQVSWQVYGDRT